MFQNHTTVHLTLVSLQFLWTFCNTLITQETFQLSYQKKSLYVKHIFSINIQVKYCVIKCNVIYSCVIKRNHQLFFIHCFLDVNIPFNPPFTIQEDWRLKIDQVPKNQRLSQSKSLRLIFVNLCWSSSFHANCRLLCQHQHVVSWVPLPNWNGHNTATPQS